MMRYLKVSGVILVVPLVSLILVRADCADAGRGALRSQPP